MYFFGEPRRIILIDVKGNLECDKLCGYVSGCNKTFQGFGKSLCVFNKGEALGRRDFVGLFFLFVEVCDQPEHLFAVLPRGYQTLATTTIEIDERSILGISSESMPAKQRRRKGYRRQREKIRRLDPPERSQSSN